MFAKTKLNKIVGNWDAPNIKINKKLANAGYGNLKVGKLGQEGILDNIAGEATFKAIAKGVQGVYDAIIDFVW